MTSDDTYTANVRVQELSREVDRILGMLASARGLLKWEIVRLALEEYADKHKDEIGKVVNG